MTDDVAEFPDNLAKMNIKIIKEVDFSRIH